MYYLCSNLAEKMIEIGWPSCSTIAHPLLSVTILSGCLCLHSS